MSSTRRLLTTLQHFVPRQTKAAADPADRPVRFGIIGAGMISQLHAAVINNCGQAELVTVYSRDLGRAAAICREFGGKPTTDLTAMLASDSLDAVVICTASGEHAHFGIQAAMAGKHVRIGLLRARAVHGGGEPVLATCPLSVDPTHMFSLR